MIKSVEWSEEGVVILDQRRLPAREIYLTCKDHFEVVDAIRNMAIRGAPAIGIAAAMGVALGVNKAQAQDIDALGREFKVICELLAATRPTAVNLFHAIERMKFAYRRNLAGGMESVRRALIAEANRQLAEDISVNRRIGAAGCALIPQRASVLTHCNTGALATGGYGTALGVIRSAVETGKEVHVYAGETRPFLQGSRLTAWELRHDGIPVTVITDSTAGFFLQQGKIDCVIVGADRVAANGDVANKIGTYTIAVLARENRIPFYVAAPLSTLDLSIADGQSIPIETRDPAELRVLQGAEILPPDVPAENPAFDVTPARFVTAIITERGVVHPPLGDGLGKLTQNEP